MASLADGGFVVVCESNDEDGSGFGIHGQRYDATGAVAGGEFRANTTTVNDQSQPSVAAFADGGFVATWTSDAQDGSGPRRNGLIQTRKTLSAAFKLHRDGLIRMRQG